MAAVRVARRVGVVLEQVDVAADALLGEPLLGVDQQLLENPLARPVVVDQLDEVVALGGGVLGVRADVQVQAGTVAEEDVGAPAPRHHPPEQVARDLVRAQSPVPVKGAGHTELGLDTHDSSLHTSTVQREITRLERHKTARSDTPRHTRDDGEPTLTPNTSRAEEIVIVDRKRRNTASLPGSDRAMRFLSRAADQGAPVDGSWRRSLATGRRARPPRWLCAGLLVPGMMASASGQRHPQTAVPPAAPTGPRTGRTCCAGVDDPAGPPRSRRDMRRRRRRSPRQCRPGVARDRLPSWPRSPPRSPTPACTTACTGRPTLSPASLLGGAVAPGTRRWWAVRDGGTGRAGPRASTHRHFGAARICSWWSTRSPGSGTASIRVRTIENCSPRGRSCCAARRRPRFRRTDSTPGWPIRTPRALGVCGGDGTVVAVATAAARHALPLAVFPGGTLNHFARDAGAADISDTATGSRDRACGISSIRPWSTPMSRSRHRSSTQPVSAATRTRCDCGRSGNRGTGSGPRHGAGDDPGSLRGNSRWPSPSTGGP